VTRREADPASPSYLQNVPTPPSGAIPQFGSFPGRVQVSPDGRVISLPVTNAVGLATTSVHRFDGLAGAWIDHDPGVTGTQPLAAATHASLPASWQVSTGWTTSFVTLPPAPNLGYAVAAWR
jgi:hypothetical protein